MFYFFLLCGLLTRLILIPLAGFKADIAFWKGWGLAAADKGVFWMMTSTNYNYPPGFSYVLWVVDKFYALFKNPHDINDYWVDGNVFYLFLIKFITIMADLLIVWLIIKISKIVLNSKSQLPRNKQIPNSNNQTKKQNNFNHLNFGHLLAIFYFLNPAVIYDGVVWGQVDQFGLALFLLSVYIVLIGKPRWGGAVFAVSCLMKFQNIIFIPLFFLYILKKYSFQEMVKSITYAVLAFLVISLPFLLNKQMDRLIWLLTINSDWFPWYSLNAFNGWWIVSGLNGMGLNDKHLVFGITSAKQLGLFMFIFAYFIGVVAVIFSKRQQLLRNFILACSLVVFGFFHLLTQSHERYLFPIMGFLPLIFLFRIKDRLLHRGGSISNFQFPIINQIQNSNDQTKKQLGFGYWDLFGSWDLVIGILISVFFFLNMYLSMGWNYPDQVIPQFTKAQTLGISFWISIVQIVLFIVFLIWVIREIGVIREVKKIGVIVGFGLILVIAVVWKNIPYLTGKAISLTSLKPVGYRQDYLEPQYNKTVESGRGVKFWNRLSVNYYFYAKGIGSHADSEITYHLGRKFSKFSSDWGIDTEADVSAKVFFSVWADGKELFKSKERGRFDRPESVTINVTNVNYLSLKITKAGESNFGAHADWLNPVLIR